MLTLLELSYSCDISTVISSLGNVPQYLLKASHSPTMCHPEGHAELSQIISAFYPLEVLH